MKSALGLLWCLSRYLTIITQYKQLLHSRRSEQAGWELSQNRITGIRHVLAILMHDARAARRDWRWADAAQGQNPEGGLRLMVRVVSIEVEKTQVLANSTSVSDQTQCGTNSCIVWLAISWLAIPCLRGPNENSQPPEAVGKVTLRGEGG
ncbi:hypothetical protein B0T24DRAFT_632675 [Lasiosphaeria ovina]|uniref:Uncharacterized protein n=1 Tax=Lasiosphaeria ovina TaxID=92902 RepID=A0AAE0K3J5_9PEZI|nr:hypothetical protein B0T24DRAFT_632675 [Lasiosphaeria ovina]